VGYLTITCSKLDLVGRKCVPHAPVRRSHRTGIEVKRIETALATGVGDGFLRRIGATGGRDGEGAECVGRPVAEFVYNNGPNLCFVGQPSRVNNWLLYRLFPIFTIQLVLKKFLGIVLPL